MRALSGLVCYVAAMHSEPESEFGRALAAIQERAGLSHQRVADAAGVDRSQVWRWVHSGSKPGYEPVRRLTAWLIAERPEVAGMAARLLPAAGYETAPGLPDAPPPPRRDRPLRALEDSDEEGLRGFLQDVLSEVYQAVGVMPCSGPDGTLPGLEELPELERLVSQMDGDRLFADPADAAAWEVRELSAPERIRLIARFRRLRDESEGTSRNALLTARPP